MPEPDWQRTVWVSRRGVTPLEPVVKPDRRYRRTCETTHPDMDKHRGKHRHAAKGGQGRNYGSMLKNRLAVRTFLAVTGGGLQSANSRVQRRPARH